MDSSVAGSNLTSKELAIGMRNSVARTSKTENEIA
jgi:hypothetical protein